MRTCSPAGGANCSPRVPNCPCHRCSCSIASPKSRKSAASMARARSARYSISAGPLVLRLSFQGRSGHAWLPRPRCAVAVARLLPRLARFGGQGTRARHRRNQIHRSGAADRKNIVYGIDIKRVFRWKLVLGIADGGCRPTVPLFIAADFRVGLFRNPEPQANGA